MPSFSSRLMSLMDSVNKSGCVFTIDHWLSIEEKDIYPYLFLSCSPQLCIKTLLTFLLTLLAYAHESYKPEKERRSARERRKRENKETEC